MIDRFERVIGLIMAMLFCMITAMEINNPTFFGVWVSGYLFGATLYYWIFRPILSSYRRLCGSSLEIMGLQRKKIELLKLHNEVLEVKEFFNNMLSDSKKAAQKKVKVKRKPGRPKKK